VADARHSRRLHDREPDCRLVHSAFDRRSPPGPMYREAHPQPAGDCITVFIPFKKRI
jgi:hypothetical protein